MSLRSFTAGIAAPLLDALRPRRRALRELRARWGQPASGSKGFASDYFDLVRGDAAGDCLDDKTWVDLEFPAVFAAMDATVTPPGSQVLFRNLRAYVHDAGELAQRYAVCAELRADARLRGRLQRALLPLQDESRARVAGSIFGPLPPPLAQRGLLWAWSLLSLVVLACVLLFAWSFWIWLAVVCVNAVVILRTGARAQRDTDVLGGCMALVRVADDLAALHGQHPSLPQLAGLAAQAENRAAFRRPLRWLSLLHAPVVDVAARLLNFAFLVELLAHARAMEQFTGLRHKLAASFDLVGDIDAALAVASWLEYFPTHCQPTITDRPLLNIRGGGHPLLKAGVANSVRLDGRSLLVTGSNMAGKTTFIKMLGINAVLAQTLGFCLAAAATIPRGRVMASIQAAHSVGSGKSHYFSELDTIHAFLARQEHGGCSILVIDELCSGTNTLERVAIARAVLESLSRHSQVLATTHDVELQADLGPRYDLCHFQEDPEVDGYFDYRLRPGAATQRNAIRLLGEMGFPAGIIARAMAYAGQRTDADAG